VSQFEFLEGDAGPERSVTIYKPGDKLYARYNIDGYSTDEQGQVNLKIQVIVLDPSDLQLFKWQGDHNRP